MRRSSAACRTSQEVLSSPVVEATLYRNWCRCHRGKFVSSIRSIEITMAAKAMEDAGYLTNLKRQAEISETNRVTSTMIYLATGDDSGGSNRRSCLIKHTGVGGCTCHVKALSILDSIPITSASLKRPRPRRTMLSSFTIVESLSFIESMRLVIATSWKSFREWTKSRHAARSKKYVATATDSRLRLQWSTTPYIHSTILCLHEASIVSPSSSLEGSIKLR
mmetsp:Transcript_9704/g.24178  ORF Transcript_9704/g.24178 Transcript_9704/m.24178 type:complete len:221 (+) Transcript_9704:322-984(+)